MRRAAAERRGAALMSRLLEGRDCVGALQHLLESKDAPEAPPLRQMRRAGLDLLHALSADEFRAFLRSPGPAGLAALTRMCGSGAARSPRSVRELLDAVAARRPELGTECRALALRGLGAHGAGPLGLQLLRDTAGRELSALKNALAPMEDGTCLHGLVFGPPASEQLFETLQHVAVQGHLVRGEGGGAPAPLQVVSDVDDTVVAQWHDKRIPSGCAYPGVRQFYRELRPPDAPLVFLTARPVVLRKFTSKKLRESGWGPNTVLAGSFRTALTPARMASRKLRELRRLRCLFPETDLCFVGDSGQADAAVALWAIESGGGSGFIHDLQRGDTAGDGTSLADLRRRGVAVFRNYAHAALLAGERGLLDEAAVRRVQAAAEGELAALVDAGASVQAALVDEVARDSALA